MLDINEILNSLPHRYPFLYVDKIIKIDLGKSIIALKNITYNEFFFQGHFPKIPVMPGVLIAEALAQTSGILYHFTTKGKKKSDIQFLTTIDKFKFKRQVKPGDTLIMESEITRVRSFLWKFSVRALVDDIEVCSGLLSSAEAKT